MNIYNHEIRPYLTERIFEFYLYILKTEFHNYKNNSDPFYFNVAINDLKSSWETLSKDSHVNGLIMGMLVYNYELDV